MKFVLLINLKLLTMSNSSSLNSAEHENFSANKYENANYFLAFSYLLEKISCSVDLSAKQVLLSRCQTAWKRALSGSSFLCHDPVMYPVTEKMFK